MELVYSPALDHTPVEAAPLASAAAHAHVTNCLNCEAELTGPYCARCGQAAATHRLTMGHLLHDIPHTIWHVDKGLFFTMRELVVRPGATILGYLRGQRVRYFAPLSLLLLVVGISSLLAVKLHIGELAQNLNPTATSEFRQAQGSTNELMLAYMKWFYVVLTPVTGWLTRRTLRRAHLNLAEAIVAVLYVTAGSTLLSLLPMPLYYWFRSPIAYGRIALLMSLLLFGYQGWAFGQLLLGSTLTRFGRWWRGLFTAVVSYLLVIVCIQLCGIGLNWSTWKSALRHEAASRQTMSPRSTPPAAQH
jgi:hypothetical protein